MSDEVKTGSIKLVADVKSDASARSTWSERDREIIEARLSYRDGSAAAYPGGPNYVEPIIDDVVRSKTEQEVSMYFNAPRMCYVAPLALASEEERIALEVAFDSYLRYIIRPRSKLEVAMDAKNLRGYSVMKQVRRYNPILRQDIPDFIVVDNLDFIVPDSSTDVESLERMCYVIRESPRKFKQWADRVNLAPESRARILSLKDVDPEDRTSKTENEILGVTTSLATEWIVRWEIMHYAEEDLPELGIRVGDRMVTVICPDAADLVLLQAPWRELDGSQRRWPYVQARCENISTQWYVTRGAGALCIDDQLEATSARNARNTMVDYYAKPMFEGEGGENTGNITFEPGSILPKGIKPAVMPQIPPTLDYIINNDRSSAGRRMGAGGVYNYSIEQSASRKVQKTAKEVMEDSSREGKLSSTAVDRFNEPIIDLFQMIFDDMARMGLQFPVVVPNRPATMINLMGYQGKVVMVPTASARTLDPDSEVNKQMALASWVVGFKDLIPVDLYKIVESVFRHYDNRLTSGWLGTPEQKMSVDQNIQQLMQNVQLLAQGGKDLSGREENCEKLLNQVVAALKKSGVQLE